MITGAERAAEAKAMTNGKPRAGFGMRLVKGSIPAAVVLGLLYALSREQGGNILEPILVEVFGAIVLWLGWRWMRGAFATRWAGRMLAAYLVLGLALITFSVTLAFSQILLLIFLMAIPAFVWDLFVGQPWKGRFSRARAERRLVAEVPADDREGRPE
jgi:uncharacterized membrane protein YeaQ/YmgE (transglycosylase-associated protein family)